MGGKILAAVIAGRLQGWTWPERWLVVGLTTPQAAATLAATYVGLSLGLYGDDVVNAVLVVVVVSLVVSTAITTYAAARVPTPVSERAPVGRRVLVGLPDASGPLLRIASLLAEADSGTVQIVRVHLGGSDTLGESQQLTNLAAETVEELGGEASSAVRLDLSVTSALRAAASELEVSAVLVQGMLPLRLGGGFHSPVASGLSVRCPAPVLVVHPGAAPVARILCRVGDDDEAGQSGLAQAVARRLAAAADVSLVSLTGAAPGPVTSGDVVVLTAAFARSPAGRELVTGVTDASGWVVVTTEARLGGSATLLRGGLVGSEVGGA